MANASIFYRDSIKTPCSIDLFLVFELNSDLQIMPKAILVSDSIKLHFRNESPEAYEEFKD